MPNRLILHGDHRQFRQRATGPLQHAMLGPASKKHLCPNSGSFTAASHAILPWQGCGRDVCSAILPALCCTPSWVPMYLRGQKFLGPAARPFCHRGRKPALRGIDHVQFWVRAHIGRLGLANVQISYREGARFRRNFSLREVGALSRGFGYGLPARERCVGRSHQFNQEDRNEHKQKLETGRVPHAP